MQDIEHLKAPFQEHLDRCIANRKITQESLRKEVMKKIASRVQLRV